MKSLRKQEAVPNLNNAIELINYKKFFSYNSVEYCNIIKRIIKKSESELIGKR